MEALSYTKVIPFPKSHCGRFAEKVHQEIFVYFNNLILNRVKYRFVKKQCRGDTIITESDYILQYMDVDIYHGGLSFISKTIAINVEKILKNRLVFHRVMIDV